MKNPRRLKGPTFLQKAFIIVICFTIAFVFLVDIYHNGPYKEPAYAEQKTLITVEAGDGRRLGNLMFSYASLVGIAKRNHMETVMPSTCRLKYVFQISAMLADDMDMILGIHEKHEEFGRRASAYDFGTETLPRINTRLLGYYQSWRYFRNATSELRSEFTFCQPIQDTALSFHKGIHIQELDDATGPGSKFQIKYVRVGIHVRRGDILQPYYQQYGYTVADAGYFTRAMAYFTERFTRVQFVVCSDDILWAKENIFPPEGSNSRVAFSEGHTDFEDLAILTLCNHTIISVGSFGWWAGWLAGGTTLYYKDWPKEYTKLEYHINKKTYFPPDWIPMS